MINVPIDKIVPLTTARDTLSKIVAEVETDTPMYVLTKGGKPSVAIVNINYLEKALGGQLSADMAEPTPSDDVGQEIQSPQATTEPAPADEESLPASQESATKIEAPIDHLVLSSSTPPPPTIAAPFDSASFQSRPLDGDGSANLAPSPAPSAPSSPAPAQGSRPADQSSASQPTVPSAPQPTTPIEPPVSQNIALGSMDGIQSKPFVPPQADPKTIDGNYSPNPAQYTGQPNGQDGTQPQGESIPDMVID